MRTLTSARKKREGRSMSDVVCDKILHTTNLPIIVCIRQATCAPHVASKTIHFVSPLVECPSVVRRPAG